MMIIIDEFKYVKLQTHTHIDEISTQFFELFKKFAKTMPVSTGSLDQDIAEIDLCIKLAKSPHHQDAYHERTLLHYIKAQEKRLINPFTGQACTYAYVPIKKVARKYLSNPSILKKVLDEKLMNPNPNQIISSALDGKFAFVG